MAIYQECVCVISQGPRVRATQAMKTIISNPYACEQVNGRSCVHVYHNEHMQSRGEYHPAAGWYPFISKIDKNKTGALFKSV